MVNKGQPHIDTLNTTFFKKIFGSSQQQKNVRILKGQSIQYDCRMRFAFWRMKSSVRT